MKPIPIKTITNEIGNGIPPTITLMSNTTGDKFIHTRNCLVSRYV